MKPESYKAMAETVKTMPLMEKNIIISGKIITTLVYLLYPAFLVFLFVNKNPGLLPAILVPGISFVLLSIFRNFYNAPRPYEFCDYEPVIKKKSGGKSFPSRHVFSIFIIAMTLFWFNKAAGILVAFAGLVLATNRVLGGVHFIKDVVSGMLIAIACGILGFYVIVPLFV